MSLFKKLFEIDFKVLVNIAIPRRLRGAKFMAWVYALVSPIVWLYDRFTAFRTATEYDLNRGPQVVHIEAVLNDRWDAGLRRVKVVDGADYDALYISQVLENKPQYLFQASENKPKHIYKDAEISASAIDFVVLVPVFIQYDAAEMTALVDKYRMKPRIFLIQQV